MPKIADIEDTPNPNAKKFILKEPLTWGIARSYDNAAQAEDDLLAASIFDIEHVTNVFYVDHWLTVTQDGRADWQQLLPGPRIGYGPPGGSEQPARLTSAAAATPVGDLRADDQQRLYMINGLLDEQIRPYLQGDGGDLHVLGLEGNKLTVHYQGACGSCPSSISGTLVSIEQLLKTIEPDIEVLAV